MARLQNQCMNMTIESMGGLPLIMIKGTFCISTYFPLDTDDFVGCNNGGRGGNISKVKRLI